MADKKKFVDIVLKNVNLPGLLFDTIDEVLEPALDKIVADSKNPFDDMAKASLYPLLEKELKELAQKKYDEFIAKLSQ